MNVERTFRLQDRSASLAIIFNFIFNKIIVFYSRSGKCNTLFRIIVTLMIQRRILTSA